MPDARVKQAATRTSRLASSVASAAKGKKQVPQKHKLSPPSLAINFEDLQSALGHRFTHDAWLTQALTHRSFATPHNERLEFLGDSVLGCTIATQLFTQFPYLPEGELSRLRANLVNQAVLVELAKRLGLSLYLRLGAGEIKTGGAQRPSILADAVEALFGAVYLDAGFAAAQAVILGQFKPLLESVVTGEPAKDAKTALQEALQSIGQPLPHYKVQHISGMAHLQLFRVECAVYGGHIILTGEGGSRREAEQKAAQAALSHLRGAGLLEKRRAARHA